MYVQLRSNKSLFVSLNTYGRTNTQAAHGTSLGMKESDFCFLFESHCVFVSLTRRYLNHELDLSFIDIFEYNHVYC